MFPLVPYSNRLGYRRFRWRGHDYTTRANVADSPHSLHGIGWQRPWRIVSSSVLEVVLELRHAGDADWPFAFTARQYFALGAGVVQGAPAAHQRRRRSSSRPASAGIPTSSSARAAACTSSCPTAGTPTRPSCRRARSPSPASTATSRTSTSTTASRAGAGRRGIRDERFSLQLASSLPYLVVYTPPERDYFCVEPVSHVSNAIHMAEPAAHGLVALAPGATLEAWMRLDVAVL